MYIFKNAFVSIIRNKGRNILMAVIIIAIACACSITLAIRSSANSLVQSYNGRYEIEGTITMNRDNLMGSFNGANREENINKFNSINPLTEEEIVKYGESVSVKSYHYTYNLSMNSSNLEKATEEINSEMQFKPSNGEVKNNKLGRGDFSVIGYNSYEAMSEFITGKYTMQEGSISDDFNSYTCVINYELATLNNIKVGDKVVLTDPNDETKNYELEVTGIYKENETGNDVVNMFSNSANTIITNNKVAQDISTNSEVNATLNPTFILKSKEAIEQFEAELKEKGLSEYYKLSTNIDTINSETKSVQSLSNYALTFLIIVLVIGGTVLLVLNMINVRERRYEIGVLRTIGMKKSLVITQFVVELFIVSTVSLLIGVGMGAILSVPTANKLLEKEIASSSEQNNDINQNFGKGGANFQINNGIVKVDKVTSIEAVVDIKVILQMLGIGIGLTLISSLAAMTSISRFSPIAILKERS